MAIFDKYLSFIDGQASYHRERSSDAALSSYQKKVHESLSWKFQALAADLIVARKALDAPRKLTPQDVADLPRRLRAGLLK
jgi:hypothetical protein